jgi:hypothetical protein
MKKKNISKTLLLSVAVPLMSSSFSTDAVSPKNNETLQAININTIIDNTTMGQLTIAPSLAAVKAFIYEQAKSKNHPDLMNDINIDITATQATVTVAEDISSIYSGSVIIS